MKKLANIALVSLFAVTLVTGCGCEKKEEPKKEEPKKDEVNFNVAEDVIRGQEVEGVTFTNTSLQYSDQGSTLVTRVTNTTDSDIDIMFNIYVKDENDELMTTMLGYIGEVIKPGESKEITSSTTVNLEKAKKIEYEKFEQ